MNYSPFAAIFLALVALAVTSRPAAAGIPVIFDQGPSTGALGPCFDNEAPSDPGPVAVHTRIFADDGTGSPGALLQEEDNAAGVEPVGSTTRDRR